MRIQLNQVRLNKFRDMGGGEIIFDFNNDRHHAVAIKHGDSPADIQRSLRKLVVAMINDEELKD